MFVPIPIIVPKIILAVFRFLLTSAFGAVLSFYSSFNGEYSNSIRWIRQGGYYEMLKALWHSRGLKPHMIKITMAVIFILSLASSFTDKLAVGFINPSVNQGKHSFVMTSSPQYIFPDIATTFTKWSTAIRPGEDVVNAVSRIFSNIDSIPGAKPGRIYIPRTFPYEVACNQLDLLLTDTSGQALVSSNGGCESVTIGGGTGNKVLYANATTIQLSKGRWSTAAPTVWEGYPNGISMDVSITRPGTRCVVEDFSEAIMSSGDPDSGLTLEPTTMTTKCVFPSGEVVVLSVSSTRFASSPANHFRNTSMAVFGEFDELLQAMEKSVNNPTFALTTGLFAEVEVKGSTATAVICDSTRPPSSTVSRLLCLYTSVDMVVTKPQTIDPIISESREGKPFSSGLCINMAVVVKHLPIAINEIQQPIPISVLKSASSRLLQYVVSHGQNVYLDWESSQLYILFDTTDSKDGVEIPIWVIIWILGSIVISTVAWGLSEKRLDKEYTSSLYMNIAMGISSRTYTTAPGLMPFKEDPMGFEGVPIFSDRANDHRNTDTSTISLV
ncbi:hypothetical protein BC939DRAFT_472998 [Gamsiella multidivaricata]|uniref:uncharacterized protein n=1 Tax=Gamsiella multidivaricata TaxID=101098 RepID=UPI00222064E1|nr:uncharacterized protein BC939DRAFT_472998 [Gamsiella multidivaricata]KAG0356058.1 hypothetical protein BGZ54_000853 [Gamsiella multidivaricata]KAI7831429.1 hypothetical protein BC939DRAFT_472998 [Gamsiella multidivaricata]